MKYSILILAALFAASALSPNAAAQDEPEEAPVRARGGIVGAGGGVDGMWYFFNASVLNGELARKGMPALSADGMFMLGGHGYAYVIVVPNLRIGGMGAGGSASVTETANGTLSRSELSTSFGGMTIEYVFPLKQLHFAVGALIGAGSNTLTLTKGPNTGRPWDAVLTDSRAEYTNSFFAYQPSVTVEYEVSPFTVLSLTGGYFGTSGNGWTLNEEFDVAGAPGFDLNNAFVRLRLTFGLFIGE